MVEFRRGEARVKLTGLREEQRRPVRFGGEDF